MRTYLESTRSLQGLTRSPAGVDKESMRSPRGPVGECKLQQKYVRALWTPGVITNLFSSYVQSTPFRMHLQATFALCGILEKYHLNREAFEWVLGEVEAKFNHDCK